MIVAVAPILLALAPAADNQSVYIEQLTPPTRARTAPVTQVTVPSASVASIRQLTPASARSAIAVASPPASAHPKCAGATARGQRTDPVCAEDIVAAPATSGPHSPESELEIGFALGAAQADQRNLPDAAVVAERLATGDVSGSAVAQAVGSGFGAPPAAAPAREPADTPAEPPQPTGATPATPDDSRSK